MSNHAGANIMVVDDEQLVRWSLENDLQRAGFSVTTASSGEEAIEAVRRNEPDLILLDIRMPGMDGIQVLHELRRLNSNSMVVMLSALADVENAVTAVRAGAYDYIPKPFDLDDVILRIDKALDHQVLEKEVRRYRSQQTDREGLQNIVAVSEPMRRIVDFIARVAQQGSSTVLIRGETGVGKDVLARAVHALSPRASKPFVEINCPSFPPHLLENELFGHERGAFTDARSQKEGLLEIAHQGAAFLNEIGDVDLTVQAKLLQFLEKKVFRRIGSTKERSIDVRIIAATNHNLEKAVEEGRFRRDLYYRLNVISIAVPPLRERVEDIPALIEHFLEQFRSEFSKPNLDIDGEAIAALMRYSWPGNVRELRNCLERAVLLGGDEPISLASLSSEIERHSQSDLSCSLESGESASPLIEQEKRLILEALEQAEWNQSQAARILRISRDTLRYRMKKYAIAPPSE
ncbi:MAG: sigma-54 dependent transcriptional regulator [Candidatus Omnitrophota bacterium]